MSHAIFIRRVAGSRPQAPMLFAYDIAEPQVADAIVRNIAASFPEHGTRASGAVHWFVLGSEILEIYASPI